MAHTGRFSDRADAYVAGRPSYPVEAVDALLAGLDDPAQLVVADLGAGTGISARALAARGPRVLALEPNAAMRAKAASDPKIIWIDGTAEATTLGDGAVDIAAAFQAWHWFDHAAALRELRRVVRPGGRIAVLYNERDESDPFTAELGDVIRGHALEPTEELRASTLARFAAIPGARRSDFHNAQALDRAGLHARLTSSSYLPQEGPAATGMHAAADTLFERYARPDRVTIHLVTTLVIADV